LLKVPRSDAKIQSLLSGTATAVVQRLLLLLLAEAPALSVRESLVYH
jgi:hypothetical protein